LTDSPLSFTVPLNLTGVEVDDPPCERPDLSIPGLLFYARSL
jgi:hypothetical protein